MEYPFEFFEVELGSRPVPSDIRMVSVELHIRSARIGEGRSRGSSCADAGASDGELKGQSSGHGSSGWLGRVASCCIFGRYLGSYHKTAAGHLKLLARLK